MVKRCGPGKASRKIREHKRRPRGHGKVKSGAYKGRSRFRVKTHYACRKLSAKQIRRDLREAKRLGY